MGSKPTSGIHNYAELCSFFDDESPPYAFVIIQGTAKFSDNQKDLLKWNTILGGRYMGEKLAEVYGKRNTVEGSLLVEVTPTKMISEKDVTGW